MATYVYASLIENIRKYVSKQALNNHFFRILFGHQNIIKSEGLREVMWTSFLETLYYTLPDIYFNKYETDVHYILFRHVLTAKHMYMFLHITDVIIYTLDELMITHLVLSPLPCFGFKNHSQCWEHSLHSHLSLALPLL